MTIVKHLVNIYCSSMKCTIDVLCHVLPDTFTERELVITQFLVAMSLQNGNNGWWNEHLRKDMRVPRHTTKKSLHLWRGYTLQEGGRNLALAPKWPTITYIHSCMTRCSGATFSLHGSYMYCLYPTNEWCVGWHECVGVTKECCFLIVALYSHKLGWKVSKFAHPLQLVCSLTHTSTHGHRHTYFTIKHSNVPMRSHSQLGL